MICECPNCRLFQEAGKKNCCYEYFSGSCPTCGMTHLCRKPQPPPKPFCKGCLCESCRCKPASPERCTRTDEHNKLLCRGDNPGDAVESKIADILWPGVNDEVRYDRKAMRVKLWELVRLARL